MQAVVFDFAESRAGQHARNFLDVTPTAGWPGTLACDQFSGYKALFEMGVVEAGNVLSDTSFRVKMLRRDEHAASKE